MNLSDLAGLGVNVRVIRVEPREGETMEQTIERGLGTVMEEIERQKAVDAMNSGNPSSDEILKALGVREVRRRPSGPFDMLIRAIAEAVESDVASCDCPDCVAASANAAGSAPVAEEQILTEQTPVAAPAPVENLDGARLVDGDDENEFELYYSRPDDGLEVTVTVPDTMIQHVREDLLDKLFERAALSGRSPVEFIRAEGGMNPSERDELRAELERSEEAEEAATKTKRRQDIINRITSTNGHPGAIASIVDELLADAN